MNEEKIKSNYAIFEEEVQQQQQVKHLDHPPPPQVKRLDEKNQQFSTDVQEKHNYIKELIADTKSGLQVTQVDELYIQRRLCHCV